MTLVYLKGRRDGRIKEKKRCEHLCHSSMTISKKILGTMRWVWNAIAEDREELLPEEEFFK